MKLHAQWITGFVDGEGCFIVSVRTAPDRQTPVQLQPAFIVSQHKMDIQVLHALKAHFGCGQVYTPTNKDYHVAQWRVDKLEHLLTYVVPFFEKHNLKTKKGIEFQRFRRICLHMKNKVHQTPEGFEMCVKLARELRVITPLDVEVDQGRVQLLSEETPSSYLRLCEFTDSKERRLTERNSLTHNWCPA